MKLFGLELKFNNFDIWHKGNLSPEDYRQKQFQYITNTAVAEGWYRIATLPLASAQFKNAMFKVKAYTASGTVTTATIMIDMAHNPGSVSAQYCGISHNVSHSYNSWTNAENGYVLLYCKVSFDVNNAYIDLYKYKATAVTIEIESLVESDWVFANGALAVNPTVGSLRNFQSTMAAGFGGNLISANNASYANYSNYGVLGTNTLSNTTDKTGQWAYLGYWLFAYNSSYMKGHSGNVRIRMQEISFDGSMNPLSMDDFAIVLSVNMGTHTDGNTFNSVVPTISVEIDGKTSLTENDIVAMVYSTSTSGKYIRLYVKLKSANTVYCINPEQRYGRSFSTSNSQTTSYSYFVYAGDATPVSTLPSPAQGSLIYATKRVIDSSTLNGQGSSYYLNYNNFNNKPNFKVDEVNQDANNLTASGFYHCLANIPTSDGENDKAVIHNQYGGSHLWATQIAISWRNNKIWFRNKENGTWESWNEISKVSDIPTKLSDLQNDIGAGGGVKITTNTIAPQSPAVGDFWYKEI